MKECSSERKVSINTLLEGTGEESLRARVGMLMSLEIVGLLWKRCHCCLFHLCLESVDQEFR